MGQGDDSSWTPVAAPPRRPLGGRSSREKPRPLIVLGVDDRAVGLFSFRDQPSCSRDNVRMRNIRRFIAAAFAALSLAAVAPAVASADIVRSGNTFAQSPAVCSCVTTIDGYVFAGMPYYDASSADDSAVELWWLLAADPNYTPLPPVTSISTDTTVSGTVDPPAEDDPDSSSSSWGR